MNYAKQIFYLNEYNWTIIAYYFVVRNHFYSISQDLQKLGYSNILYDISTIIGNTNGGYCYTNYKDKISIIFVNRASNRGEFMNTLIHELNHIGSHIEEYYNIDSHGEEACYLMGSLAQNIFNYINYFSY